MSRLNEKHHVDEQVEKAFGKLSIKAPAGSWKQIEQRLDAENRRRGLLIFLPWAAAIVLALTLGILFHQSPTPKYTSNPARIDALEQINLTDEESLQLNQSLIAESAEQLTSINPSQVASSAIKSVENQSLQINSNTKNNSTQAMLAQTSNSMSESSFPDKKSDEAFDPWEQVPSITWLMITNDESLERETSPSMIKSSIPVLAFCEETPDESKVLFNLAGQLAPIYSVGSSGTTNNAFFTQTGGEVNHNHESGTFALAGGLDLGMERKRWAFSSGVHLSRLGIGIQDVVVSKIVFPSNQSTSLAATSYGNVLLNQSRSPISVDDVNDLNSASSSDFLSVTYEETDASLHTYFDFVEIPFSVSYKLIQKRVELSLVSGISLSVLYNNKVELDYQNNLTSLGPMSNLNTLSYTSLVGMRLTYPISSSLKFHLQPLYRHSLSPLNKDFVVNYYLQSFALGTGILFTF